jgi:hypothetical protein
MTIEFAHPGSFSWQVYNQAMIDGATHEEAVKVAYAALLAKRENNKEETDDNDNQSN